MFLEQALEAMFLGIRIGIFESKFKLDRLTAIFLVETIKNRLSVEV